VLVVVIDDDYALFRPSPLPIPTPVIRACACHCHLPAC
jgi:hypothetical protein